MRSGSRHVDHLPVMRIKGDPLVLEQLPLTGLPPRARCWDAGFAFCDVEAVSPLPERSSRSFSIRPPPPRFAECGGDDSQLSQDQPPHQGAGDGLSGQTYSRPDSPGPPSLLTGTYGSLLSSCWGAPSIIRSSPDRLEGKAASVVDSRRGWAVVGERIDGSTGWRFARL